MFDGYPWETCSPPFFLKGNRRGIDLGERGVWKQGLGGVKGRETIVRIYYIIEE